MGREAKSIKERICEHCEAIYFMDAASIKAHAKMCKSAKAAGLILPRVERPKFEIIHP